MFIQFLKENKLLYIFLITYFLIGGFFLTQFDKGDFVIWLNNTHTPFLDYFFKYLTKFGEEIFLIAFFLLLIFKKKYYLSVFLIINVLVNGLIIQLLKWTIFNEYMRPLAVLGKEGFHFVEGVRVNTHHSFPSGHTNTGFAFFILLAMFSQNSFIKVFLAFVAIIVGISRVYLFQHFFIDTYFGGMIGVFLTTIIYIYIENYTSLRKRLLKK